MKVLMRIVCAAAMTAMLVIPVLQLAAVQAPTESKCGHGDKVVCVSIRYCFFWAPRKIAF
ncbi:MAG: hypothetical protein OXK74_13815 [Gemmatimonadota bacterium]|nr:hypothetical protein [Gemmatimonadota bacterium]